MESVVQFMVPVFNSKQLSKSESDAFSRIVPTIFARYSCSDVLALSACYQYFASLLNVIFFICFVYTHDLNGSCYSYQKLVHPCCMRMCPTGL